MKISEKIGMSLAAFVMCPMMSDDPNAPKRSYFGYLFRAWKAIWFNGND